jgi:hypothetical protein
MNNPIRIRDLSFLLAEIKNSTLQKMVTYKGERIEIYFSIMT